MGISETSILKKNVIYKATHYPADLSDCGWRTALFGDDSIISNHRKSSTSLCIILFK